MKKLSLVMALAMVIGVGVAYASSIAVPWFVDSAPTMSGLPPSSGVLTLIYLKNNTIEDITAEVFYTSANGTVLDDPATPANESEYPNNTFIIPARSTVAYRPYANDVGGQESAVAGAIPNRPKYVSDDPTTDKFNGSAAISWTGGPNDVQGMVATTAPNMSYAHLLPPGN